MTMATTAGVSSLTSAAEPDIVPSMKNELTDSAIAEIIAKQKERQANMTPEELAEQKKKNEELATSVRNNDYESAPWLETLSLEQYEKNKRRGQDLGFKIREQIEIKIAEKGEPLEIAPGSHYTPLEWDNTYRTPQIDLFMHIHYFAKTEEDWVQYENLAHGVKSKTPMQLTEGSCLMDCKYCNEEPGVFFDGEKFSYETQCEYPNGFPVYDTEIDVPSGKLVFYNSLRNLGYTEPDEQWDSNDPKFHSERPWKKYDYNSDIGMKNTHAYYAEQGLAYVYVGNTSPDVHLQDDGTILVGVSGMDYDEDGVETDEISLPGKNIGNICTDLWAYNAVDYDDYVARGGEVPEEWGGFARPFIIDVEPGRYAFSHEYLSLRRQDKECGKEPTIYSRIRKISDL